MDVTLVIHVEPGDHHFVWWAESPQLAGLTVSADSLAELRPVLSDVLNELADEMGEAISVTGEELAGAEVPTPGAPGGAVVAVKGEPPHAEPKPGVRRVLIAV